MDDPELGQGRVGCGQAEQLGQRVQDRGSFARAFLTVGFQVEEDYESETSINCSKCKSNTRTSSGLRCTCGVGSI